MMGIGDRWDCSSASLKIINYVGVVKKGRQLIVITASLLVQIALSMSIKKASPSIKLSNITYCNLCLRIYIELLLNLFYSAVHGCDRE